MTNLLMNLNLPVLIGEATSHVASAKWTLSPIIQWTVDIGIFTLAIGMLLCIGRLLKGPHLSDRALSADTLGVHVIGLVILLTIRVGTLVFMDGILVLSLLSFAGTVAMAQYIGRPHLKKAAGTGLTRNRKTTT